MSGKIKKEKVDGAKKVVTKVKPKSNSNSYAIGNVGFALYGDDFNSIKTFCPYGSVMDHRN